MALPDCRQERDASGRLTLILRENERCQTDAISAESARLLNDHAGRFLDLQPGWSGAVELKAKQFVGTLVFQDLTIRIEPKVPVRNLFYMLTYAYDLPAFRRETTPLAESDDLFQFVITIFVRQVQRLVRQGIYRQYVNRNTAEPFLKGRLDVTRQLQRQPAVADRFHQEISDYTADVLENRILKYTLWWLSRAPTVNAQQRRDLRRALSAFSDVELVRVTARDCDDVVFQRLNAPYHSPIHLAQLLLQNLSVEGHSGRRAFATFMLPMYQVFELFVARYLAQKLADDPRLAIEIQPTIWLDDRQDDRGTPDIILTQDGQPVLVLDTKYKTFDTSPNPDDRNQMLVYCQTLRLTQALLIYANPQPVDYRNQFSGVTLRGQALDLSGDLAVFERRCQAFVSRLIDRM